MPEFVGDALREKLMTTVAAGEPPDVAWVHADYLYDLARNDAICAMDHFMKGPDGSPASDLKDIPPGLLEMASVKDAKILDQAAARCNQYLQEPEEDW